MFTVSQDNAPCLVPRYLVSKLSDAAHQQGEKVNLKSLPKVLFGIVMVPGTFWDVNRKRVGNQRRDL